LLVFFGTTVTLKGGVKWEVKRKLLKKQQKLKKLRSNIDAGVSWSRHYFRKQKRMISNKHSADEEPPKNKPTQGVIPFAVQSPVRMTTKGGYKHGWPVGAIVHFTAGRFVGGVRKALDSIAKSPYTFLCIGNDGALVQAHDITKWGHHAGESGWKQAVGIYKLVGSVSDETVGIEMNCAGKPTKFEDKFYPWWEMDGKRPKKGATDIPESDVRYVTEEKYGCPTGYYHKYTPEQEATLIKTLRWLKAQRPDVFQYDYVLGHHEVAGLLGIGYFRKNDPGGSLSMTMAQLRDLLKRGE